MRVWRYEIVCPWVPPGWATTDPGSLALTIGHRPVAFGGVERRASVGDYEAAGIDVTSGAPLDQGALQVVAQEARKCIHIYLYDDGFHFGGGPSIDRRDVESAVAAVDVMDAQVVLSDDLTASVIRQGAVATADWLGVLDTFTVERR